MIPTPEDGDGYVTRFVSARVAKVDVLDDHRLGGYAIVFNALSQDLGGFLERISPSAVDRTLRAGDNVLALADHRMETTSVLGSSESGRLLMSKESYGLRVKIDPPDTSVARDVMTVVKAGLVKGMSFSFRVMPDGQAWDEENGQLVRTITDMAFREVSIVVSPAYLQTSVAARNARIDAAALEEARSLGWKPSMDFRRRQLRARGIA